MNHMIGAATPKLFHNIRPRVEVELYLEGFATNRATLSSLNYSVGMKVCRKEIKHDPGHNKTTAIL